MIPNGIQRDMRRQVHPVRHTNRAVRSLSANGLAQNF